MRNGKSTVIGQSMSLEAYLAFEENADVRHEFIDGQLYPMPGTTDTHNLICGNIYIALRQLLAKSPCKVFMESVKVQVLDGRHYTYPDVFVTCDEKDNEDAYIKRHPIVIVEVASPSTRVRDKTDKFIAYRQIPSLQHYLVVDTDLQMVECYSRTDEVEEWTVDVFPLTAKNIPLTALKVELVLSSVY